jgi:coenzyme PQQ precursor peptide PqqA
MPRQHGRNTATCAGNAVVIDGLVVDKACAGDILIIALPAWVAPILCHTEGVVAMAWTRPKLREICIGMEINGYLPAEL